MITCFQVLLNTHSTHWWQQAWFTSITEEKWSLFYPQISWITSFSKYMLGWLLQSSYSLQGLWTGKPHHTLCPWDSPGRDHRSGLAMASLGGSSWPRDWTPVSCLLRAWFFTSSHLGSPSCFHWRKNCVYCRAEEARENLSFSRRRRIWGPCCADCTVRSSGLWVCRPLPF